MAREYQLEEGSIQYQFNQMRNAVQIFGGGFGNGKTTAGVVKALQLSQAYPGSNGLIARASYPKLRDTVQKEFFNWCPTDWVRRMPTKDDNTCYLHNGSVINFRYVAQRGKEREDGTTSSNLLSASYDWILVDQVEDPEIQFKDLLDLLGRLRGQTAYRPSRDEYDGTMPVTGPRFLMLTANPSQGWFFREIVRPFIMWRDSGVKTDKLLWDTTNNRPLVDLVEGSTYTNAKNLPIDYLRNLESAYQGQMRERYLMGKWAAFEGLVYPEFDRGTHGLTQEQIDDYLADCLQRHVELRALEAYDFGIKSPTCYGLGSVDEYGRVVLLDGFYRPEFNYTEHVPEIMRIRAKYPFLKYEQPVRADPSIFRRTVVAGHRSNAGESIATLLRKDGLNVAPADNELLSGISKFAGYLSTYTSIPHPVTGDLKSPMFYVNLTLDWFLDEVIAYYWKRNNQQQFIDEPIDANDHAMDMSRYLFTKLPAAVDVVIPKHKLQPEWMFWREIEEAGSVRVRS